MTDMVHSELGEGLILIGLSVDALDINYYAKTIKQLGKHFMESTVFPAALGLGFDIRDILRLHLQGAD